MSITQQYADVAAEVERVCLENGRNPEEVRLVAVSKTVDADRVQDAIDGGAVDFGENRPEQIMEKQARYPRARWHFIGNIQSRRIKDIVPCAHLIHSVFKEDHMRKISAAAESIGKVQDILIEVNVSGELSKGGIEPDQLRDMLRASADLPGVRVCGLMTMAPQGDLELASKCFADLRELKESTDPLCRELGIAPLSELSMGMSEDWRCAIAQSATIVRIGRAIFSDSFAG